MRLVIALLISLLAAPAVAQDAPICLLETDLFRILTEQYDERVVGSHIERDGTTYHIWANPETTTWTLTGQRLGNPVMCILNSGSGYDGTMPPMFIPALYKIFGEPV